jgi:hypothetical protein
MPVNQILGRGCSTATFEKLDVNAINSFFTNLGPETVKSIPQSASSHMKFVLPVANTFFSFEVTHNELFNVVTSLPSKTSSGFDKLSTRNLKLIFPYISDTVLKIVNKSFRTGIFPDILKIARVIPIHKGGSKDKLINYRPISVLSSFSKIIERLMFNRMCNFLCVNVDKTHFMFFSKRGCVCDRVLKLRSCSVKLVQSTKFLGVYIDDKLNWAVHITELVTKLNRSLGMMKVASHCLPHDVLLQIFYAFFTVI